MAKHKTVEQDETQGQEAPAVEPQAEEQETERLNHWAAAHRVVKQIDGDTCLSELANDADKLVMESGGKSNSDRAWNTIYQVLQSLEELGMVELSEEVTVHPLHRLPSADGQK